MYCLFLQLVVYSNCMQLVVFFVILFDKSERKVNNFILK